MTQFGFPYRIGTDGLTGSAGREAHLRGMIEQMLTRALVGDNFKIEVLDIPGAPTLTVSLTLATGEAKIEADATAMTLTWGQSTVKLSLDVVSINGSNLKVLP